MTHVRLSLLVIGSTLIILLTIGCGGGSAVQPQPGAIFSGAMELSSSGTGSNVTVDGGEFEFTVTDDGTGIASITYNLFNAVCTNESKNTRREGGMSSSVSSYPPTPITNGAFEYETEDIKIKGSFVSTIEATGTVEMSTSVKSEVDNNFFTCDYGAWNWIAVVR